MNKNKGITLIALVITIIVMIILAGTTINLVINDGGTISKSENAKKENLRAQVLDLIQNETKTAIDEFGEYDQNLAISNIIENYDETKIKELVVETNRRLGITFEEQGNEFKYVVSNKGEETAVSEYIYEKENTKYYEDKKISELNDKTNIDISKAYDLLAPVPLGFVASKAGKELTPEEIATNEDGTVSVLVTDIEGTPQTNQLYYYGEDKIEYGLVIYEGNKEVNSLNLEEAKTTRDQFVWIPVKEEDLNALLVSDKNGELYYYDKIQFSGSPVKEYLIVEPYFTLSDYNHPKNNKIVINNSEITDEKLNMLLRKDFNDAVENVKKIGGFYISRYILSNNELLDKGNNNLEISFLKGNEVYKGKTWYTYWNSQKNYINNERISSNMIFGFQYRLLSNFLEKKVINGNGTYKYFYNDWIVDNKYLNYFGSDLKNNYDGFKTGENECNKVCNIYDIMGSLRVSMQSSVVNSFEFEVNMNSVDGSIEGKMKNIKVLGESAPDYTTNKFKIINKEIEYFEPITYHLSKDASTYYCINNGKILDYKINEKTKEISGNIEIYIYKRETETSTVATEHHQTIKDSFTGKIDENGNIIGKTEGFYLGIVELGGNHKDGIRGGRYLIPRIPSWDYPGTTSSSRTTLCLK